MVTTAILQKAIKVQRVNIPAIPASSWPPSLCPKLKFKPTPMFQLFQQVPEVKWTLHEKEFCTR